MLSGTPFHVSRRTASTAGIMLAHWAETVASTCAAPTTCSNVPETFRALPQQICSVACNDDDDVQIRTFRDIHDGLSALVHPDRNCLADGLQKCISRAHVQCHHYCIIVAELEQDTRLANLLVTMYARYGDLQDSRAVFDETRTRTVVTWTAIITFLAKEDLNANVLLLYRRMQEEGTLPNNVTLIGVLCSCIRRSSLLEGRRIHGCMEKDQFFDVILSTSLLSMYGRCGSLEDAHILFGQLLNANIITWNAIITVYVDHEHGEEALNFFHQMQSVGVNPNNCTYINSLKACGLIEDMGQGRAIHSCVVEQGWISDLMVCNSLLNMYGKCGALDEAFCVFEKMPRYDFISWNDIINSCAQQGRGAEGLELYRTMQQQGLKPEKATFIGVIGACASIAALKEGKCIHACLADSGVEADLHIRNALIHMYGQCGALGSASVVFGRVESHNVVSWTAIITAFSQQGHAKAALQLFDAMLRDGVKPDLVAYIAVLSACSYAGLLEEGQQYFGTMEKESGLIPNVEHYGCMVSLYGRAGLLSKAKQLICKFPCWHDECLWAALLSSCTLHCDYYWGQYAAEQMINLHPEQTASYVLLGNLYAANDRRKDPKGMKSY